MDSLRAGYRALVLGAGGGLGCAFVRSIEADPRAGGVIGLSRRTSPACDVTDEASVAAAARHVQAQWGEEPLDLLIYAVGLLTFETEQGPVGPEKSLQVIDPTIMARSYAVNAIGAALTLKHFSPLLARGRRAVAALLSARVGSIGDNRLGGWYSYRASKAALNQIVHTAALELQRSRRELVCVAMHPGTVATPLSDPYAGSRERLTPDDASGRMLGVLDRLTPAQSGGFFAYDGQGIVW